MAQASSAQREPSMEEILASIRRIIEDSDQVGRKSGESLKCIDDLSRHGDGNDGEAGAIPTAPLEKVQRGGARFEADAALPGVGARQATQRDVFAASRTAFEDRKLGGGEDEAVRRQEGGEEEPASSHPLFGISRPNIMSKEPERQVGAAFNRLSEAVAVSRRRNLDEVAEEMLRPMLQDWLDNNLPALVERLVREEIERVARLGD